MSESIPVDRKTAFNDSAEEQTVESQTEYSVSHVMRKTDQKQRWNYSVFSDTESEKILQHITATALK